ncbi:MAG: hypothetical protein ACXIT9_09355 [Nitritalea sp.]
MTNREKLEKMDRALRLLEDLKNTQTSMVEKVSHLQLEAMEFNFSTMEKNMADLFTRFNEGLDLLQEEIDRFEIKRNQFEQEHKLDRVEE